VELPAPTSLFGHLLCRMALFAFTSRQVEALCKARPPTAGGRRRPSIDTPAPLPADAQRPRATAGPELNWEDLPEARLPGGAGRKSRQMGYRPNRMRFRSKSLGLPLISEVEHSSKDGEVEEAEQEHACEEESHPAAWCCPSCTFLNYSLLPACEMCQTQRDAEPAQDLLEALGSSAMMLQEAASEESDHEEDVWVHCEVSSVGSSWLDVETTNLCKESDGEASAILACDAGSAEVTPPAVTSWAARAKNIAEQGVAVKVPAHGTAMPPLWRRALKEPEPHEYKAEDEEEEKEVPEFADMQARRLHPQVSRGSTQRMRVARWHQ